MGGLVSHPAATSVRQSAAAALPGVAGASSGPLDLRDPPSRLDPCPGANRGGDAHPTVWLRSQSQYSSPLPHARWRLSPHRWHPDLPGHTVPALLETIIAPKRVPILKEIRAFIPKRFLDSAMAMA